MTQFRFALIAPVIHGVYPDTSATACYKQGNASPLDIFVSTKTDSKLHGIGTKIIRHAVENNHGFVNYSIEGGFFVATVVLPVSLNV